MIEYILLAIAATGLAASTIYLGLAIVAAVRFRVSAPPKAAISEGNAAWPPVTVLKPLRGMEPLLKECLEGFFRQDYPVYELLFSARTAADPALTVVELLRREYPGFPCASSSPANRNTRMPKYMLWRKWRPSLLILFL